MSAINGKMLTTRLSLAGFFIIAACRAAAYAAFAEGKTVTVNYKTVMHGTEEHIIKAGDQPDHFLWAGESRGLTIFEIGEIATDKGWWLLDITGTDNQEHGSGSGYHAYTFEDGSTILFTFESTFKPGKYSSVENASHTITGGTGRFKGIKGKGTATGRHIASPESDYYVEGTLTYTLP